MKLFWFFLFLFISTSINCHIYLNNCADRVGLANINLISKSPLTSYYNPAISNQGIACSISQPFGFSGIENGSLCVSKDVKTINITYATNYLLSSNFKEFVNELSINYSFKDMIILGISHKHVSICETSNYSGHLSDVGILIKNDAIKFAFSYSNILNDNNSRIELPKILTSEVSYRFNDITSFAIAIEKEMEEQINSKLGIRYTPIKSMSILSGYSYEANQIFAGLDVEYKRFMIAYAISNHVDLGISHYISLIYDL